MQVIRIGNKELIKEINRSKVINLVRDRTMSRVEISKLSNLGMSTVTYIVDEFLKDGLVKEVGESKSTGGRRAKLLEFNNDIGTIISVKIEEERLLVALTNLSGGILQQRKVNFEKNSKPQYVVNLIENVSKELIVSHPTGEKGLMGIGISSSGLINRKEGEIIRSSLLGWEQVPITKMLKEKFKKDIPIFVDKNINALTLAELRLGEGKSTNNFICVSVGAGLGLSTVINNRVYHGGFGGAGEFGHTTIEVEGYQCHCGQKGCLEMYASEFYFKHRGMEIMDEYPNTSLKTFYFEEVCKAAKGGDQLAKRLLDEMSKYLGSGIRNLINTLNPEKVIVVGEGMEYKDLFMEEVINICNRNFFSKSALNTPIVISELKNNAWLVGTALMAIDHLFKEPIYED